MFNAAKDVCADLKCPTSLSPVMYFSYKQDDIGQGLGMVASQLEELNALQEMRQHPVALPNIFTAAWKTEDPVKTHPPLPQGTTLLLKSPISWDDSKLTAENGSF
ncbi:hypothetical protein DUI87_15315 [Hirundo rustica rustica]|uniref:Uncharacterized protein n=1 Tax=Hirundo rustica rustica TaxID=333673 RepID=A0A3M0K3T9_HIRRU|nr:hypothetical protein DUI87_15315 [Hirundo rustica rustica]